MRYGITGRRVSALILTLVLATASRGQTVTLPTIRTTKSLEVDMLLRFIQSASKQKLTFVDSSQNGEATLHCDLGKLAVASLNDDEAKDAARGGLITAAA